MPGRAPAHHAALCPPASILTEPLRPGLHGTAGRQNDVVTNELEPDSVRALLRTRRTLLADVDRGEDAPERVLARSDVSGTMQLYELVSGDLVRLTSLSEPVASAHYVPGARRAVLAIDEGGNERHQLYVIDLDDAAAATVDGV